jgi:hypothetical protein
VVWSNIQMYQFRYNHYMRTGGMLSRTFKNFRTHSPHQGGRNKSRSSISISSMLQPQTGWWQYQYFNNFV